jgi:DUF971 family protein
MNISAAVIVTTPQRLSFVDVVKGIDLFDTVNIPSVAVVENMAEYSTYHFNSDFYENLNEQIESIYTASILFHSKSLSNKNDILDVIQSSTSSVMKLIQNNIESQKKPITLFGLGHSNRLKDMWGIDNIIRIPIQESVSLCGDTGNPYVLKYPDSDVANSMIDLAKLVIQEIDRLSTKQNLLESIKYDEERNQLQLMNNDSTVSVSSYELRVNCRCAVCVEEFTGRVLLDKTKVPVTVRPQNMNRIGRYAISVDWSDGHKSLYPFKSIVKLATSQ